MNTIFTDGSCFGNPGPGGWCAIIISHNRVIILKGREKETTNNRMELVGAIEALKHIKSNESWIFSDSKYVIDGINTWVQNWVKNNWKGSNKKQVKNQDLWKELFDLNQKKKPHWIWVKGHNKNFYNEKADKIAQEMTKSFDSSTKIK